MSSVSERLQHAWNAFKNKDPALPVGEIGEQQNSGPYSYGVSLGSSVYPERRRYYYGKDQTIVSAVINRMATDCSLANLRHVRVDENGGYLEDVDSGLNYCLRQEANIDQNDKAFVLDVIQSLLEIGVVAVVPVDTTINPAVSGSYQIQSLRVGRIVGWYPQHVRVNLYNDKTGQKEDVLLPKNVTAIIENPFYSVMNEPNGVLQRLNKKLGQLDVIDNQSSSGKLDLIIQLPYVIKSKSREEQAEKRRKQIEDQLAGSKYGIAYTDGTERIVQLNRSVENNLMAQITYLTSMLYSQLGLNEDILNGTANETTMMNYYKRTIDVILNTITSEFERKFLTKTARSQGQAVRFFRDPFSLTPSSDLAEIADKFTRNEILTSNEVRGVVGFKPSMDPGADELRNKNLNQNSEMLEFPYEGDEYEDEFRYDEVLDE